jgi:phosphoribosylaminoimidazole carboxylase (NCAIR synthetase)
MDVRISVLDPTPNAPATVAATQTLGSFRDAAAVRAFAATVDVLTVEIEHVDAVRHRITRKHASALESRYRRV